MRLLLPLSRPKQKLAQAPQFTLAEVTELRLVKFLHRTIQFLEDRFPVFRQSHPNHPTVIAAPLAFNKTGFFQPAHQSRNVRLGRHHPLGDLVNLHWFSFTA